MNYVIIDVETTGLSNEDEIVQLAMLDLRDNKTVMYSSYCNPTVPMSPGAYRVNKLEPLDLLRRSKGMSFVDIYPKFEKFILDPTVVWVGHNVSFDLRMLDVCLAKFNLPKRVSMTSYCTLRGSDRKGSLSRSIEALGINLDKEVLRLSRDVLKEDVSTHDARMDVLLTYHLLMEDMKDE